MTLEAFKKLMSFDTSNNLCIEIFFRVQGSDKFNSCWMGKLPSKETKNNVFWFGLTPDGKNAYDYSTFEEFSSAEAFDGKSLIEIWENITIVDINGCDPAEMIEMYSSGNGGLEAPQ